MLPTGLLLVWRPALLSLVVAIGLAPMSLQAAETELNGFKLIPSSVPAGEILSGGPPRDGIPALESPKHAPVSEARWTDDAIVMGLVQGGEARAYPIAILTLHEIVNDTLGGVPILVSYCPLCGTGLAFDRRVDGRARTFGVSGLLYRSGLLLYDRETESLWSQIESTAVTGPALGTRLRVLRSTMARWSDWKGAHPDTTVLTPETGYPLDYAQSPYVAYATSDGLLFPAPVDSRYHPKMPTIGVRLAGGKARAYAAAELSRAGGSVSERFEGHAISVRYDVERQVFEAEAPAEVEVIEGYWFAWVAFHPETTVFVAP